MSVPEAAVYLDDRSIPRQLDIGPAWQHGIVQGKPKASPVQKRSQAQFGFCVLAAYAGHHPASGCLVYNISH